MWMAVKCIIRYLKGSMDEGMILKPNSNLSVDCYVDGSQMHHQVSKGFYG